jgi:predicted negative regulator of RcsB-dependent stress response
MALDLNEDKDLNEKVSDFFSKNKKNIILFSIIFLVFYFASTFYISQGEKKYFLASDLYQKIQLAKEITDVEGLANELKEKYANTAYASRASIYLGNIYFKNKDFFKAQESYKWAADNATENSISSLANYQLGVMLFSNKDFDSAMHAANSIKDNGFIGLKNNLLGDLFSSLGKIEDARKSYQTAYEFYKDKNDLAKVVKIKIDSISQN